MAYFLFKTFVTAILIAGVSELGKRFTLLSSILASLPLTSILIFVWIYVEQKDVQKIAGMSEDIFFLVIPSLAFFILLTVLLRRGIGFVPAIGIDVAATFFLYLGYVKILKLIRPDFL